MRIQKPWTAWDDSINYKTLPGAMGVFEIADNEQKTIYIGYRGFVHCHTPWFDKSIVACVVMIPPC